ncbi:N-acetylmuramoyl-L-alanine amidase [Streptomyces lydicus]|uniref:N-acetylmuramoyl-L-alanine amidase n=1 Tax=Streptomyces lydicus TaxID=47763 RepID=UPI0036E00161
MMATPLTPARLLSALLAEGVFVVERPGWRTHNRNAKGSWRTVDGLIFQDTYTLGTVASLSHYENGDAARLGPLCHGVIDKDGTVYLVGNGRANHVRLGDREVLKAVRAGRPVPLARNADVDGNAHFYGFACVNIGDGEDPWPCAQLAALARVAVAMCRAHCWPATSVLGHAEWEPDVSGPSGFAMNDLRRYVAARLKGRPVRDPFWSGTSPRALREGVHARPDTIRQARTPTNPQLAPARVQAARSGSYARKAATSYEPPLFPDGLMPNHRSPGVRLLQRALIDGGWLDRYLKPSDHYGRQIQEAVSAFNHHHNLAADGDHDPVIRPRGWVLLHRLTYSE